LPGSSTPRVVKCWLGRASASPSNGRRDRVASRTTSDAAATSDTEPATRPPCRSAKAAARSAAVSWTRGPGSPGSGAGPSP
jgi:hypothetical protein